MPLTDTKAKNAKPKDKQYKLFELDGRFLLVSPAGGKVWRFKYRFGGKEKLLSLGTYPEVSLSNHRNRGTRVACGVTANRITGSPGKRPTVSQKSQALD